MHTVTGADGRPSGSPPDNEVPVGVAISAILARTDHLAVALIGAHAYSCGVGFDIAIRFRAEPRARRGARVFELINWHEPPESTGELDERFLLGVEYPDGRTATNLGGPWPGWSSDSDDTDPLLRSTGGSGGGRRYDQRFFLSPLPPTGPLTVVCRWPAFGVAETQTAIDGTAIADAGAQALVLWPRPSEYDEPREPPEPLLPGTGWFAQALRDHGGEE